MNLSDKDRRALTFLVVSLILAGIYWLATSGSSSPAPKVVAAVDSVDHAEKALANFRAQAATIPGKQEVLKQVSKELSDREKGLIKGDTAPQAQAQLLQILREVARNQSPPLEIKQVELGQAKPYGDAYGQVSVSVNLDCRIDQLVNYLAFLSAQPELLSSDEIRFTGANPKLKTNQVRLTISGLTQRKLIPKQKGLGVF